jgi:hypothetical protein
VHGDRDSSWTSLMRMGESILSNGRHLEAVARVISTDRPFPNSVATVQSKGANVKTLSKVKFTLTSQVKSSRSL